MEFQVLKEMDPLQTLTYLINPSTSQAQWGAQRHKGKSDLTAVLRGSFRNYDVLWLITEGFIYIYCKVFTESLVTPPYLYYLIFFLFCLFHVLYCKLSVLCSLYVLLYLSFNFMFQDYSVTYGHCPEITVYTSCCYFPSAAQLPSLWAENKRSLLSMLVEVSPSLLTGIELLGLPLVQTFIVALS